MSRNSQSSASALTSGRNSTVDPSVGLTTGASEFDAVGNPNNVRSGQSGIGSSVVSGIPGIRSENLRRRSNTWGNWHMGPVSVDPKIEIYFDYRIPLFCAKELKYIEIPVPPPEERSRSVAERRSATIIPTKITENSKINKKVLDQVSTNFNRAVFRNEQLSKES